jgi:hypothetical protein
MRFGGKITSDGNLYQIAMMVVGGDTTLIKRLKSVQLKYDNYTKNIEKEYGSIENFIKNEYLQGCGDKKCYNLSLNKFPYNTNLKHLVLWSNCYLTNQEIEIILKRELKDTYYFWFEQSYENKSVKSVNHVHVFL